ncbi:MAG: hypothetical protein FJZ11_06325 [Candidatus Omnitrophica bacterium]|nr:hypothetical protein [Candidatus Omnitrophota bacterium]
MIINIQDAHCNYEAQKNMAKILEYLIKERGIKLILVEGGSGNVNLSFLRNYADQKARAEVADDYLKMGKISGEEYLDIISDYGFELYGIEDEALYDAHMAAFWKIDSIKEEGLRNLEDLSRIVKNLKPLIYSEELRQLEEEENKYENKLISLAEYSWYLKGLAENKGLKFSVYPHLGSFSQTAKLEKEIDFQQAELQRNAFAKELANLLDEKGVQELIEKTGEFKTKKITQQEYYAFLQFKAANKIDLEHSYPQLFAYIKYITISKDIDAAKLLEEVSAVKGALAEACLTNSEQKELNRIAKSLYIFSRLLKLELTPEDYAYFQNNKGDFLTASWIDFLTEQGNKYNLPLSPVASSAIDDNLNDMNGFYQLGKAREKAFIKNTVEKMDESGQNFAVLIMGGFHTPGVTEMLKNKGYSYLVVAPVITQKSDPSIYFSVLKNEERSAAADLNREE